MKSTMKKTLITTVLAFTASGLCCVHHGIQL
jgi:hypothetical protein